MASYRAPDAPAPFRSQPIYCEDCGQEILTNPLHTDGSTAGEPRVVCYYCWKMAELERRQVSEVTG